MHNKRQICRLIFIKVLDIRRRANNCTDEMASTKCLQMAELCSSPTFLSLTSERP